MEVLLRGAGKNVNYMLMWAVELMMDRRIEGVGVRMGM